MFSKTLTYNGPFIVEIIRHTLSLLCLELIFQFGNNFKTFLFASPVVSKKRHHVVERNCVCMCMCITQWLAAIQLNDFQHFISSKDFTNISWTEVLQKRFVLCYAVVTSS